MKKTIDRIMLAALTIVVAVLVATSLPTLSGHHLSGTTLRIHMMASGALVIGLPIFAVYWILRCINPSSSGFVQRTGYWFVLTTGLLSIATAFACMLPIASTAQMKQLMLWHGYIGFTMVPAIILILIGARIWGQSSRETS